MGAKRYVPAIGLLILLATASLALAQDAPPPADEPGDEEAKKGIKNGLYVQAMTGSAMPDDVDTSIVTASTHNTSTIVSFDDQKYARAAIGWSLPFNKGDFRVQFTGLKEDGYSLVSTGFNRGAINLSQVEQIDVQPWWSLEIDNGVLTATRTPYTWIDSNGDGNAVNSEIVAGAPDVMISRPAVDNLQNRIQTIDLLYGRKFGNRRYSAQWFGGLRYFQYDGTMPATAWVGSTAQVAPGIGFSDGITIPLLQLRQESTAVGPTGSIEAQFNFFDKRFQAFLGGEVAFVLANLDVESNPFFTLIILTGGEADVLGTIDARLKNSETKSTWQNGAFAGARWNMRNGLSFEVAYGVNGYLDVIQLPRELLIPARQSQAAGGTSALYKTEDVVTDFWRAGFSFQF